MLTEFAQTTTIFTQQRQQLCIPLGCLNRGNSNNQTIVNRLSAVTSRYGNRLSAVTSRNGNNATKQAGQWYVIASKTGKSSFRQSADHIVYVQVLQLCSQHSCFALPRYDTIGNIVINAAYRDSALGLWCSCQCLRNKLVTWRATEASPKSFTSCSISEACHNPRHTLTTQVQISGEDA